VLIEGRDVAIEPFMDLDPGLGIAPTVAVGEELDTARVQGDGVAEEIRQFSGARPGNGGAGARELKSPRCGDHLRRCWHTASR
jgi:hypothetical protein